MVSRFRGRRPRKQGIQYVSYISSVAWQKFVKVCPIADTEALNFWEIYWVINFFFLKYPSTLCIRKIAIDVNKNFISQSRGIYRIMGSLFRTL